MGLVLPTEGGSANVWDVVLDTVFGVIDGHNHAPGNGALVPSAGLGINADLTFAAFGATNLSIATFREVAASAVASYVDGLFVNSTDHNLYFRNAAGVNVQITSGNSLDLSAFGGIGGDYSTVGALLSYDDATRRYLLQQEGSPRPWAGLATADIDLYQKAASITNKVTLKSPAALAANYTVTFPAAVPAQNSLLQMTPTGALIQSSTLDTNVNLQLQGTGYVQRGAALRVIPISLDCYVLAGSVAAVTGKAGRAQQPSSTVYYPIPTAAQHEQLNSIIVGNTAVGGSPTYTIELSSNLDGAFSDVSNPVTSAANAVTVSVLLPGPGGSLTHWLKVVTDSATTVTLANVTLSTTVP